MHLLHSEAIRGEPDALGSFYPRFEPTVKTCNADFYFRFRPTVGFRANDQPPEPGKRRTFGNASLSSQ